MNLNNFLEPPRIQASSIEELRWLDRSIFLKRDDLIHPLFSGNKYRKLYHFLNLEPFPYRRIISYGGVQSNAMLSMAAMAALKKVPFIYHVRYLAKQAQAQKEGNLALALELGMTLKIVEADHDEAIGASLKETLDQETLLIPQGGASPKAYEGVKALADAVIAFKRAHKIEHLMVATPSGTGTTALWLHDVCSLEGGITVVTAPAVGDKEYLISQMRRLKPVGSLPLIITTQRKYAFAKPHKDLYRQYENFKKRGISFDLIYAPVMWQALEEHQDLWKNFTLLYVHSGGTAGNSTQLARYEAKGMIP